MFYFTMDGEVSEEDWDNLEDHIRELDTSKARASFMIDNLRVLAEQVGYAVVNVEKEDDVYKVEFHTNGWSDAETLIHLINMGLVSYLYKTMWKRGGHFYYEVPARHYEGD